MKKIKKKGMRSNNGVNFIDPVLGNLFYNLNGMIQYVFNNQNSFNMDGENYKRCRAIANLLDCSNGFQNLSVDMPLAFEVLSKYLFVIQTAYVNACIENGATIEEAVEYFSSHIIEGAVLVSCWVREHTFEMDSEIISMLQDHFSGKYSLDQDTLSMLFINSRLMQSTLTNLAEIRRDVFHVMDDSFVNTSSIKYN